MILVKEFSTYLFLILLLSISAVSCERVIDPFEKSSGTYSVYGSLDVDEEQHRIRVRNVSVPFLADSAIGYDDISVFFQYPDDSFVQLEDTIINFNGNYTYNYLIDGQLEPDTEYAVQLRFNETEEATSIISTPRVSFVDTTPDQSNGCDQELRIFFQNVDEPEFVIAEVGVRYDGSAHWAPIGTVAKIEQVPNSDRMEVQLSVTNLLVDIFPPAPEATIGIPPRFWRPTVSCTQLDEFTMYLRYIHFGKEWEEFRDSDFLDFQFVDSDDVENGIGFVGAIRRGETSFNFRLN